VLRVFGEVVTTSIAQLMVVASIYWRRARGKLPKDFACDCGWRHQHGRFEYEHWNDIQTITCHDCGDIYRTFQNTMFPLFRTHCIGA
jgi:hypothetical protein